MYTQYCRFKFAMNIASFKISFYKLFTIILYYHAKVEGSTYSDIHLPAAGIYVYFGNICFYVFQLNNNTYLKIQFSSSF